jgi:probable HAF family extracellular repeat protein
MAKRGLIKPLDLEVSMNCYLPFSLLSHFANPGSNKKKCSMKNIATVALLLFALMVPQIGEAQPVTTAAKPESPGKKPPPPTEINYTVTEVFPLKDRYIGAFNRSRELALIGDFAGSFADKKRKVTDFECLVFSSGATRHFTTPLGINNHGDIAGFCHDDLGQMHTGFLRSKNGSLLQFTAPGSTSTVAYGVNDFGQIVGQSSGTSGTFSFIRSSDGMQYQNILPPTIEALVQAVAINNSGKLVGHYSDSSGQHAFLWDNGQFTELRVPGATGGDVRQLNNNDQALMFATVDGVGSHYLYDAGNYLRINNPKGYTWQTVIALNDNGELTGFAFDDQNVFFDIIAKPNKK